MYKNNDPLVSICVTFFNAGGLIRRILDSSLNQTYRNIEVVIVDDVSTDDSEKIISEYVARDKRVRYFRNTERIFIIKSLLKILELARGKFVIWPGADDWLSRDFIANGVRDFLKQKGFEILSAGLSYIAKQKASLDEAGMEKVAHFVEAVEEALGKLAVSATCTRSRHPRAMDPAALAKRLAAFCPDVHVMSDAADAYTYLLNAVAGSDAIVVTGSLYLVGELRAALRHANGRATRSVTATL